MQTAEPTTVTGRPATIATGFRLTLSRYKKAVQIAVREGLTFSAKTAQLWEREIERVEQGGELCRPS